MRDNRRTVLVTGSSKGLGRSLALVFAKNDCDVIVHGRDQHALEDVRKLILESGVECEIVSGDITAAAVREELSQAAARRDLDVLVNNAGVYLRGGMMELESDQLRRVIDVNLIAPIELTKSIYPIFARKRSGLIVNVNSVAGKRPNETEGAYCASKYGLRGFTTCLQLEAARHNVGVIGIHLGALNTAITMDRGDQEKLIQTAEAATAIFSACQELNSVRVRELELGRRNY